MSITYEQAQMIFEGKWKELAESMSDFSNASHWRTRYKDRLSLVAEFSLIVNVYNSKPDRTLNHGYRIINEVHSECIYETANPAEKGVWYREITFDIINGVPYLVLHSYPDELICWKVEDKKGE